MQGKRLMEPMNKIFYLSAVIATFIVLALLGTWLWHIDISAQMKQGQEDRAAIMDTLKVRRAEFDKIEKNQDSLMRMIRGSQRPIRKVTINHPWIKFGGK